VIWTGLPLPAELAELAVLAGCFAPQALSSSTATMTRENTIFFISASLIKSDNAIPIGWANGSSRYFNLRTISVAGFQLLSGFCQTVS
jgi:hypothetical protein